MKKIFTSLSLLLVFLLSSCGGNKVITPQDTAIEGNLAGCFTLEDAEYPIEGKGDNRSVTVRVKRTDISTPFTSKTVGSYGQETLFTAGFGYEFFDKDGNSIFKIEPEDNDEDTEAQLEILNLNPGETGELSLPIDAGLEPAKVALVTGFQFNSTGDIELQGAVGDYPVKNFVVDFLLDKSTMSGQYQYETSPEGAFLYIFGKTQLIQVEEGNYEYKVKFLEDNGKGQISADFDGKLEIKRDAETSPYYYLLTGNFTNSKAKEFYLSLKSKPFDELYADYTPGESTIPDPTQYDYSMLNDYGWNSAAEDNAPEVEESDGEEAVGNSEFVAEYVKFMKAYIKALKAAQKGNTKEYMEMLDQYKNYVMKLDKISGELSEEDIKTIDKLTQEITEEMSKLEL